jgi:hypothetical protein
LSFFLRLRAAINAATLNTSNRSNQPKPNMILASQTPLP